MVDDLLSPAFNAVRNSDTELLQELFRNGLASPFMVTKMGDTLLHVRHLAYPLIQCYLQYMLT